MPIYHVKHTTKYLYPSPVTDSANQIILSPPSDEQQEIITHEIRIKPGAIVDSYFDYFGNKVGVFTIVEPHTDLIIVVDAEVQTKAVPVPTDFWPAKTQWDRIDELSGEVAFFGFCKIWKLFVSVQYSGRNCIVGKSRKYNSCLRSGTLFLRVR